MRDFTKFFCIVLISQVLFFSKILAAPTLVDSFSVNSEETTPNGLSFNNDGTKMFIVGHQGDDVNEYTLSTGFDLSTATFVDSFSVSSEDDDARHAQFNQNGTNMFVFGKEKCCY